MNILLLIFDDLRADFGLPDLPASLIPNIDHLRRRGVTFQQAHCPCAICAPARASFFTGLDPQTHGVTTLGEKLRDKLPDLLTWPQLLRERGWSTTRSGKVYHKGVPDCLVTLDDGDDDPRSWDRVHNPPGYELHSNGVYVNATPWETHRAGSGGAVAWLKAEKADDLQHDWRVATRIREEIRNHDGTTPALWAAGFIRPHLPLVAPKAYFEQVAHLDILLPEQPANATPVPDHVRGRWCGDWRLDDEQRREAIRAYLACVRFADEQVGRILDQLRDAGREEDTLVILTSDHGFQLGEHGLWFKNFLYRESTHVPLVIADPRRPGTHGRTCDALVSHTDLFPTLVDLLGLPAPSVPFDGCSYASLLDHPDGTVRESLATMVDWGDIQGRAVRTPDRLDIEWTGRVSRSQRFDVIRDPGEHVDLLSPSGKAAAPLPSPK